jgi:Na+/H+-dicarboxylate symporter
MQASPRLIPLPLYTQVLIAVACGPLLGVVFGQEPYLGGLRNEHLGWLGLLLVTLLKTSLSRSSLRSSMRSSAPPSRYVREPSYSHLFRQRSVAMTIGLVIMNTWQPGLAWNGHVETC